MKSQKKIPPKDSIDRSEPAALKEQVRQWKKWMAGDDKFSIRNQIIDMLRDDAIFRVLNECAGLQEDSETDSVQINGYVWEFIFRNYFRSQALQIRCLTQKQAQNEDRRVISLRAVLNEMADNRSLLTRAGLFNTRGLEYKYESQKKIYDEASSRWASQQYAAGKKTSSRRISHESVKWRNSEDLHQAFDRWSGMSEETRSPSDTIKEEVFDDLKSKLGVCAHVEEFVNKQIAHAADPSNRPRHVQPVCLKKIYDCHRAICSLAAFLAIHILGLPDGIFQPPITIDVLAHLDKPWSRKTDHTRLCDVLRKHCEDIQKWTRPDVG